MTKRTAGALTLFFYFFILCFFIWGVLHAYNSVKENSKANTLHIIGPCHYKEYSWLCIDTTVIVEPGKYDSVQAYWLGFMDALKEEHSEVSQTRIGDWTQIQFSKTRTWTLDSMYTRHSFSIDSNDVLKYGFIPK